MEHILSIVKSVFFFILLFKRLEGRYCLNPFFSDYYCFRFTFYHSRWRFNLECHRRDQFSLLQVEIQFLSPRGVSTTRVALGGQSALVTTGGDSIFVTTPLAVVQHYLSDVLMSRFPTAVVSSDGVDCAYIPHPTRDPTGGGAWIGDITGPFQGMVNPTTKTH